MSSLTTIVLIITAVLAQCPDNDESCSKCVGKTCIACINSYADIFGNCIDSPSKKVTNCYHYFQSGKCLVCQMKYTRNNDFECDAIPIANCAMTDVSGKCTACMNGWRVDNNACSEVNKCSSANCGICYEDNSCYQCSAGYSRDSKGECIANTDKIQDCRQLDVNGECIICKENYFDRSGKCILAKNAKISGIVFALLVFISAFVV